MLSTQPHLLTSKYNVYKIAKFQARVSLLFENGEVVSVELPVLGHPLKDLLTKQQVVDSISKATEEIIDWYQRDQRERLYAKVCHNYVRRCYSKAGGE